MKKIASIFAPLVLLGTSLMAAPAQAACEGSFQTSPNTMETFSNNGASGTISVNGKTQASFDFHDFNQTVQFNQYCISAKAHEQDYLNAQAAQQQRYVSPPPVVYSPPPVVYRQPPVVYRDRADDFLIGAFFGIGATIMLNQHSHHSYYNHGYYRPYGGWNTRGFHRH